MLDIINQADGMAKVIDYFYTGSQDTVLISDGTGNIMYQVTRQQVIDMLSKKAQIELDAEFEQSYKKISEAKCAKPVAVKMFLTDCDGCLTDGGMYYSEKGDELKKFNTKDGMGFSFLRNKGIITGIVTGEDVELNRRRANKLKLDILEAGCSDKLSTVKRLCEKYNISLAEVVYVGDDVNDLEVIRNVGFGCCPQNAVQAVKKEAKFITQAKGGEGVIREVIDYLQV